MKTPFITLLMLLISALVAGNEWHVILYEQLVNPVWIVFWRGDWEEQYT